MPHTTPDPLTAYTARLQARQQTAATLAQQHRRLGPVRLLLVLAAIAAAVAVHRYASHPTAAIYAAALALPVPLFLGAAIWQAAIARRQVHVQRAIAFYQHGMARIEDRWVGVKPRSRTAPPHHLYASDLDLFGHASVFELLCNARTRMGEETLAAWLLAPAPFVEVSARHAALAELRDRLELQEAMGTLGPATVATEELAVQPELLVTWAETANPLPKVWLRWVTLLLAALNITALLYWALTQTLLPLLLILALQYGLAFFTYKTTRKAFEGADAALAQLSLLAALLQRFEQESLSSERLLALQQVLRSGSIPSSAAIAKLAGLVSYVEAAGNPFVRMFFDVQLGYSTQMAYLLQDWRTHHGPAVRTWLAALGDVEALLSLATYSYEHPADPLPEFLPDTHATYLAEALGHPLIPAAKCVRNDVALTGETRALIISGSNMSGKSTLMRAVGINAMLAMAGAPVRATRLRLTPVAVGASILVNDSLEEGSSRFYAEITRIQQICALARQPHATPVLFLLDELLQGTNSSDRLVGARGIVRALLDAGAIGILSTHDLALTALAETEDPRLHNMHLQDAIANGRMVFDHTLREGVVTRSNGVELMRLVGLDV